MMDKFDQGVIVSATILCQLGYWTQAADMLAETGMKFDVSDIDEFDRWYMLKLIETEPKRLNGCLMVEL